MKIITIAAGPVNTNAYILYDESTLNGVLIDPGAEADKITDEIDKAGIKIVAILVTHGHFDHIGAVDELRERLGVPAYASQKEADLAADVNLNCSTALRREIVCKIDKIIEENEILDFDFVKIDTIFTPGHTHGHNCFYLATENVLFSGDCLFKNSYGRYDLPTSNFEQLKASLFKLFELPNETKVYPGHGTPTEISYEKNNNPILKS